MKMFDHMEEGADFLEKMNERPIYGLWVAFTLPFRILWWHFTD